jgi:hypothetical protein
VLDLIGTPIATAFAAMAMYVASSEDHTTREYVGLYSTLVLPPIYLTSTIIGFARNRRCRDALSRSTPAGAPSSSSPATSRAW